MAYNITYDEMNARYLATGYSDTILIIKPFEKDGTWIGVEYDDTHNATLNNGEIAHIENYTYNDILDEIDAAILFKTKDLPTMLRELANLMEGK